MNHSEFDSLVSSITPDASAEELLYDGLCGLIAAEISMKRQSMKMSQKQFADFMGVSQGLVSRWERGDANFTLESLVSIASKLGLEMQSPFKPTPAKTPYVTSGKTVSVKWRGATYTEPEAYTILSEM